MMGSDEEQLVDRLGAAREKLQLALKRQLGLDHGEALAMSNAIEDMIAVMIDQKLSAEQRPAGFAVSHPCW